MVLGGVFWTGIGGGGASETRFEPREPPLEEAEESNGALLLRELELFPWLTEDDDAAAAGSESSGGRVRQTTAVTDCKKPPDPKFGPTHVFPINQKQKEGLK